MHKKDVLEYFTEKEENRLRLDKTGASANIAKALRITTSAIAQWGEIVPEKSAEKLHRITFGKIPLKERHYNN